MRALVSMEDIEERKQVIKTLLDDFSHVVEADSHDSTMKMIEHATYASTLSVWAGYNLVVLTENMPGNDAPRTLKILREKLGYKGLCIIIANKNILSEEKALLKECGATDVHIGQFDRDALAATMRGLRPINVPMKKQAFLTHFTKL